MPELRISAHKQGKCESSLLPCISRASACIEDAAAEGAPGLPMANEGSSESNPVAATTSPASITEPVNSSVGAVIVTATRSTSAYRVEVPFTDFAGRCFLRGCLCADLLTSWIHKKQWQSDTKIQPSSSWCDHLHMMGWLRSSLGAASCTATAGCLIPLFASNTYQTIVPLFFLLVILYVALRFGHVAGIIGTIGAALVFELFLFAPRLSLAIESRSARNHLISMVILGICASELLGRRKIPVVYKPW
jgi:K+-sensing histidine kinase KdpD